MSSKPTKKASSANKKTIPVELEKAEEKKPMKQAVSQVAPEIIATIKHQAQIEEEIVKEIENQEKAIADEQLKNKFLFYTGVAGCVGILYLCHRYYSGKTPIPPEEFVQELVNGVAGVIPK